MNNKAVYGSYKSFEKNVELRDEYVSMQMSWNNEHEIYADREVIEFIANVVYHKCNEVNAEDSANAIHHLFRSGYCLYFATMLQTAFQRGVVCMAYPFGHVVWVDTKNGDNIPYDVDGVYTGDAMYFVPIDRIPEAMQRFLHAGIPERNPDDDVTYVNNVIKEMCSRYKPDLEFWFLNSYTYHDVFMERYPVAYKACTLGKYDDVAVIVKAFIDAYNQQFYEPKLYTGKLNE